MRFKPRNLSETSLVKYCEPMKHLALVICFAAAGMAAPLDGVPNFQKVNDGVYRGGQPSSGGFKSLAGLGVRTVIDLRPAGEHSQDREKSWVESSGMHYVSVPLRGMSAPSPGDVAKILAILNRASAGPVFVHCRRGADRTGTIIACYRISHDRWENREALHEARGYGMSMWERAMMHYVLGYRAPVDADVASTSVQ